MKIKKWWVFEGVYSHPLYQSVENSLGYIWWLLFIPVPVPVSNPIPVPLVHYVLVPLLHWILILLVVSIRVWVRMFSVRVFCIIVFLLFILVMSFSIADWFYFSCTRQTVSIPPSLISNPHFSCMRLTFSFLLFLFRALHLVYETNCFFSLSFHFH